MEEYRKLCRWEESIKMEPKEKDVFMINYVLLHP